MNHYRSLVTFNFDLGHLAASHLRDSVEDALIGMLEHGEEISVELISGSQFAIDLSMDRELGDMEEIGIRDSLTDFCSGALDSEAGETITVAQFSMASLPNNGIGRNL